jgi:hypothetical protein
MQASKVQHSSSRAGASGGRGSRGCRLMLSAEQMLGGTGSEVRDLIFSAEGNSSPFAVVFAG